MSWKTAVQSSSAEIRRARRALVPQATASERPAARRRRELAQQALTAAAEAEAFANYLDVLVSVHKDCGHRWDWAKVALLPAPQPGPGTAAPIRTATNEEAAHQALVSYSPGLLDRLLGRDAAIRARLSAAVEHARAMDEARYQSGVQACTREREAHTQRVAMWEWFNQLARGIQARQPQAYDPALKYLVGFDEMEELGNTLIVSAIESDVVAIDCIVRDKEVVPDEEITVTAKGKPSTKKMAEGKRNALYQDHICSSALRIAREVFALLPIDRVVVNVGGGILDTSTGHIVQSTLLGVHFTRARLEALNFEAIDPSDAMRNFDHRMAFKKTTGMGQVQAITVHDQWVSAG